MTALNENAITRVATVGGINARAVAASALYTVPAGKKFLPDHIVIRVTGFTAGSKATQAVASFGGNDPDFNDFLDSVTYTSTAAGRFIRSGVDDAERPVYEGGSVFKMAIETGSDADAETWAVDVWGYLV